MEEYDAQIKETTPYPSTESIPELVLVESDSITEQQSPKKTVHPTPLPLDIKTREPAKLSFIPLPLQTPGSSRKRNIPKFMSDNPQQDSGTSEEEIIYIEDDEEFTPVQMMKKQADKMMMPPPQDTTQWQVIRSVYKHPQATRSVCK